MESIKLLDVCREYHSILNTLEEEGDRYYPLLENIFSKLSGYLHVTDDLEARRYSKTLYIKRYNLLHGIITEYERQHTYLLGEYEELIDKVESGLTTDEFEKKYFGSKEKNS